MGPGRPASNARTRIIDLRAATMSTVELLVVLYFLLVAVALLALYLVERRWRKGP